MSERARWVRIGKWKKTFVLGIRAGRKKQGGGGYRENEQKEKEQMAPFSPLPNHQSALINPHQSSRISRPT